jgi:hypothetical protein
LPFLIDQVKKTAGGLTRQLGGAPAWPGSIDRGEGDIPG